MGWTSYNVTPTGSSQADDAQLMTNDNNLQQSFTFPTDILITDVVTTASGLTETHQFAFQVNGIKSTSNAYTAIIDPGTDGRITWRDLNIVIPRNNSFAVSTGQTSAGAAETWRIFIKYDPVA
jgi:hypothetical protein